MKIAKIAMATLITTGLSLSMVACSSEDNDIQGQDQTTVTESSTTTTATATPVSDATQNDEGEDVADEPAPPTEVTGLSEVAEHYVNYHQIPMDYLNGVLDGGVPSSSQFAGGGDTPTFYYDSGDLTMLVSDDGEIMDLAPARASLGHNDEFIPRGIYDPDAPQDDFQFTR